VRDPTNHFPSTYNVRAGSRSSSRPTSPMTLDLPISRRSTRTPTLPSGKIPPSSQRRRQKTGLPSVRNTRPPGSHTNSVSKTLPPRSRRSKPAAMLLLMTTSRYVTLLSDCVVCLWTRLITSHARDLACAGQTSSVENLVDRFVHPPNEWPVVSVVGCEDRFKSVSPFQLMSGTTYCDRFSCECYPEVAGPQLVASSRKEKKNRHTGHCPPIDRHFWKSTGPKTKPR